MSNSYGQVRVIKPHSLIAWFATLTPPLRTKTLGQVWSCAIPNTPVVSTWGLKPTTGKLSEIKTAAQEEKYFHIKAQIYYKALVHNTTFGQFRYIHSNMISFEH